MHVVALVADLMDRTRIGAAATAAGADLRVVTRPESLEVGEGELVLVDLGLEGAIGAVRTLPPGTQVVGYGPHVDTARLSAGRAAGCTTVLARSAFFTRLPDLLAAPG